MEFRPATAEDTDLLVRLYEPVHGGGYSACFDKYGPIGPQDFWWVQSEKEVHLLVVNGQPAGFLVAGRDGRRMLVEELVARPVQVRGRPEPMSPTDEVLLRRVWRLLVDRHQAARQESVMLRTHEGNLLALALARHHGFSLVNALRTVVRRDRPRPPDAPEGYVLRRAEAGDAPDIARLHHEAYGERLREAEVAQRIGRPHTRTFVCERMGVPVGYAHVVLRGGIGDLWVAVREGHRRRGVGTALAAAAVAFLHTREHPARLNHWGLDPAAVALARRLGFVTERVHLYFERAI
ncbi:MAG: GNAT family N-acetyltransferase [Armatimonadota bacterium]|nr:GNAT family N-acetyltransferase [Armatimonadota bacterium]MDW8155193.1 GNAT family N-acetyltransferase [Armatimonadota bacterium]